MYLLPKLKAAAPFFVWVAYPLIIFFGLKFLAPRYVALMLGVLLFIKWRRDAALWLKSLAKINLAIVMALLSLILATLIYDSEFLLRLYPVFVNIGMLILFVFSLIFPPTIIESFARVRTPNLTSAGVQYTRTVTYVWCAFFIINGLISLYTACYSNQATWALYNGLIAYLLIGLLFAVEWLFRRKQNFNQAG